MDLIAFTGLDVEYPSKSKDVQALRERSADAMVWYYYVVVDGPSNSCLSSKRKNIFHLLAKLAQPTRYTNGSSIDLNDIHQII
eukprot:scaffold1519_cov166-Amphora_coffeaeformis.AAC.13